jgi:hypothetical protein
MYSVPVQGSEFKVSGILATWNPAPGLCTYCFAISAKDAKKFI